MDQIMPLLMGIVILVVLWTLRVAAKQRSDARCLDLRRATYLMHSNADLMKRVLENPHVPKILKRSLISFSDALTDRAIALEVARGLPGNLQGQLSPRAGDREGAAAGLQKNDPVAFAEFADAHTLQQFNMFFVSRNVARAQPGDIFFYRRKTTKGLSYHSMIFIGPSQVKPDSEIYVVYHTGPDGTNDGEIRRLSLTQLLLYPDPQWHAIAANPQFLGVYRWNILKEVS